jgi:hypothetical protein
MTDQRTKLTVKHIHEGRYAADVEVSLVFDGSEWEPLIGPSDIAKLDRVTRALRSGNLSAAAKEAKVFELLPLAGE